MKKSAKSKKIDAVIAPGKRETGRFVDADP
jgi:hypothetical protein